jgi:hypothetical protein
MSKCVRAFVTRGEAEFPPSQGWFVRDRKGKVQIGPGNE